MMIDDYYSSFMAILAQHITYEFAVRVQRQCDGQGEPFELNLFHFFDPLCLMCVWILKTNLQRLPTTPSG